MDKKKTSDNKWNKQILPPDGIPLLLFIIDHQFFPFSGQNRRDRK